MRLVLLLLLAWASAAVAAPRIRVALLAEAKVAGETVLLGEVAHLRSAELDLMRKLVSLPLGRAPQAGQVAGLQREALAHWIRRQTGLGPETVDLQGPAEARVTRLGRQLAGEEIARAALDALRQSMAARGMAGDAQVRVLPRDIDVAGGDVRLVVRPLEHQGLRRRVVAWVDVWSQGAFVRAVPVGLEVSADAATALGMEEHALLREEGGERAGVTAPPEPAAVLRGEWATLRSVTGPVSLESRVEVLQDGRVGQKVRVRASGGTALVLARVIGRGQLELAP